MTEIPRRRALINGLFVQFQSRNPNVAKVRWHSRFKQRYRTKADALMAKDAWERRGNILWPEDFNGARRRSRWQRRCGGGKIGNNLRCVYDRLWSLHSRWRL
jgi:hypothetical protein